MDQSSMAAKFMREKVDRELYKEWIRQTITEPSDQSYHHRERSPDIMQKEGTIIYKAFFQKELNPTLIRPLNLTTSS